MANEIKNLTGSTKTNLKFSRNTIPEEIIKYMLDDGYFIAYLNYTVYIGRYIDKQLRFYKDNQETTLTIEELKHLQKLRIFNTKEELYIWNSSKQEYSARYRNDTNGEELIECIESNQILFGTRKIELNNQYTAIRENRGTEIILPFSNMDIDDKTKRIAIKTRYYIDYNPLGIAQYTDMRFCSFVGIDKNTESPIGKEK